MMTFLEDRDAHVIVVDDQREYLSLAATLLSPYFQVHPFVSGQRMLDYVEAGGPADLILLDVVMPEIRGYEVCERLRRKPELADVPVIFLTSLDSSEEEEYALALGAMDFITKPFSAPTMVARVRNHVRLSRATRLVRQQKEILEQKVAERTLDLVQANEELRRRADEIALTQEAIMLAFTALAESRHRETGQHIRRTQKYVRELALELRNHPRYAPQLGDEVIDLLYKSAPMHDIGKVGVPDAILLKPGPLDTHEFETMKAHTTIGRDAIARAEAMIGGENSFLRYAREIAYSHQEKWDGSGYPQGLKGEAIPLAARIMAVADVYDALISRRVYKEPVPHAQAVGVMREGRGTHFDPDMIDAFVRIADRFERISRQHPDGGDEARSAA